MKKKIIYSLLAILTVLSCTACAKPTATPDEGLPVSALSEYTIVYPAGYTEFRMDIVNELKSVIEHLTSATVKTAPDTEAVQGKEIILASSDRITAFDAEIDAFGSTMDYVVAVDGENIVLGGQNYYSDMRAVYDFINNYLGYDDIAKTYGTPTKKIDGIYKNADYKRPDFTIVATCWTAHFGETYYIKDIADANFNMMTFFPLGHSELEMHKITRDCARFEVLLTESISNNENQMLYPELYTDCPAIYGAYLWDEPIDVEMINGLIEDYLASYSQYGWKPMVNFASDNAKYWKDSESFNKLDAVTFDWYIFVTNTPEEAASELNGEGALYTFVMQNNLNLSNELDMELWTYIQSYKRSGGYFFPEVAYKWQMYMDLCFDTDAILYFEYMTQADPEKHPWRASRNLVVNPDFSKGENYYYAQEANAEILKIHEILSGYEYLGAYTEQKREDQYYANFTEYEDFGVIEDIDDSKTMQLYGRQNSYLIGCYGKENSNEKAFILMNFDIPTGENNATLATKIKINGDKVTCYKNGIPEVMTPDANGYYEFRIKDADCYLVTVE